MALDDGGSPAAGNAIAALWKTLRHERSLGMGGPGAGADPSNVVHMARLRRCP